MEAKLFTKFCVVYRAWLRAFSTVTLAVFFVFGLVCVGLAVLFGNCAATPSTNSAYSGYSAEPGLIEKKIINPIALSREKSRGIPPESEWNRTKVWHRISNDPPTYLPRGYSSQQPRGNDDGTWIIDKRDGKRLFVPKGGVGDFPEGALLGEARSATEWINELRKALY